MKILVIGSPLNLAEAKLKFDGTHDFTLAEGHHKAQAYFAHADVIFDFDIDANPERIKVYPHPLRSAVLLNTWTVSLKSIISVGATDVAPLVAGFCGMPGFFNRELLELSVLNNDQRASLADLCRAFPTRYEVVADRVGMVTPRVVCMIINEAYCTAEEGTASREDIDIAMKLGTNCPYGPFEWAKRIGIENICKLLDAVHRDTGDGRYKACTLLRQESLH